MALALTDIGAPVGYAGLTNTASVTLTTGVDLLVVRHANCDNSDVVTAMSYNGVSLTRSGSATPNTGTITMWFQVAPSGTGSAHNLVITLDGGSHRCRYDYLTFTGAHQTVPLGTFSSTNGTGTSMSRTITDGAVGGFVVDGGYMFQSGGVAPVPSVANGQTPDTNSATSASALEPYLASSHVAGSASVTSGWTWTGSFSYAFGAVAVNAAATATGSKNLLLLGVG